MSSASPQSVKGFTVQIGGPEGYRRLRAAQNGLFYWELASQQVLLDEMGQFFPQVTEGKDCGVFSKVVAGREISEKSAPIGFYKIPREQIAAMESSVARLEAHLLDPKLTPEARRLIQSLKFPDPTRLPEFYRVCDRGVVIVIWGCERTSLDSITPKEAIAKLPREGRTAAFWRKRKALLAWLLLALLLALLIGFFLAWPHAELRVSKESLALGEIVRLDVTGTKGREATLKWEGPAKPVFANPWKADGENQCSVHGAALRSFSDMPQPVDLQLGTVGDTVISCIAKNSFLGIPLPNATARRSVRVILPPLKPIPQEPPKQEPPPVFVSGDQNLRVKVTSPKGIFPATLEAVAERVGQLDFSGLKKVKCEPKKPVTVRAYSKPGIYPVDLLSEDEPNARDRAYVRLAPGSEAVKVVANLRLSKTNAFPGERVVADSGRSYHREPDGQIAERELSLDGGKTFQKMNDTVQEVPLRKPGKIEVVLRVKDEQGRVAEDKETLTVEEPKQLSPENLASALSSGGELYIPEKLLFPSGSATISAQGKAVLQDFGMEAAKQKETIESIEVVGHTDDVPIRGSGLFASNMALSEARAKAAADVLLASRALPVALVKVTGAGESSPLVPNSNPQNRATNRRIQIKVTKKQ